MIKLKVVINSSTERAALKTEIASRRLEIDESYGNLKLAQDTQRKSIIATEKLVKDEDQIIVEEVKINMECEETEKEGAQNDKFNNFQ